MVSLSIDFYSGTDPDTSQGFFDHGLPLYFYTHLYTQPVQIHEFH